MTDMKIVILIIRTTALWGKDRRIVAVLLATFTVRFYA